MKKILLLFLVVITVFIIYCFYEDKNTYYLSMGDYLSYGINNLNKVDNNYNNYLIKKYNLKKYINYSYIDDYRVMDLINDIKYNKKIFYNNKEYNIQNLLVKSNLIVISIGMNDLVYKKDIDLSYVNNLLEDIDSLLSNIRKYNKDKIYFLGFYNIIDNENIIDYANKRLNNICKNNNIYFVNIDGLNNYIIDGLYPTNDGYSYISSRFTK